MISAQYRFRGRSSLNYVYRSGQTIRGPLFSVKYALNPRRTSYRAAVVVSKKVHKSAFGRNRMRRRLYELIRQQQPSISQPYDIVVTVFHDTVLTATSQELSQQLKKQFKMAGITRRAKNSDPPTGRQVSEL